MTDKLINNTILNEVLTEHEFINLDNVLTKYVFAFNGNFFGEYCYKWVLKQIIPTTICIYIEFSFTIPLVKLLIHDIDIILDNKEWGYTGSVNINGSNIRINIIGYLYRVLEYTSYTMNLLTYTSNGITVERAPESMDFDISPYKTILDHIQNKHIYDISKLPVNHKQRIYGLFDLIDYLSNGWIIHPDQITAYVARNKLYKYNETTLNISDDKNCMVCKSDFETDQILLKSNNCNHVCHAACIIKWFNTSVPLPKQDSIYKCPYCQKPYDFTLSTDKLIL
jgi:mRNA-degrading endonuclease HigB of HigAB toxin-antitoxin module